MNVRSRVVRASCTGTRRGAGRYRPVSGLGDRNVEPSALAGSRHRLARMCDMSGGRVGLDCDVDLARPKPGMDLRCDKKISGIVMLCPKGSHFGIRFDRAWFSAFHGGDGT